VTGGDVMHPIISTYRCPWI